MKLSNPPLHKKPRKKQKSEKDRSSYHPTHSSQDKFHERFRASDEFFHQLVESLEDYAIFTTDINGNISSWNSGAKKILGYSEKEIIGKNSSILFTREDLQKGAAEKELRTALRKGKATNERWHLRKDKSCFWGSGLVFPLYDTDRNVRGFTKVMRDLTERRLVVAQEKRFQSVIENSSEGIRLIDKSGKILYASPSTKRILGYSNKEYVSKKILNLIHPDDKEKYLQAMKEVLQNPGKTVHVIYRVKHKNGSYRWMEGVGTNLLHDPTVNALVSNFRDITDRIELERKKDEFVSLASHELKTPLTSLKLYTDMLRRKIKEKNYESAEVFADKVKQQTSKLSELVNDLLDISRIETGKLRIHFEKFDLCELLYDIVEDIQYTTNKHTIICKAKKGLTVKADRYRIYQVLTNLLTNAMKYSPEGTSIIVRAKQKEKFVEVQVKDEGIGIPKKQQKMIFEKLYQIGESKKTFPGLGMGLYISKEIVTRHGGKIWVKSKEASASGKKGSTFYFTLPLSQ